MTTKTLDFNVLVSPTHGEDGHHGYIAQCVNYDIAAQGKTVSEVLDSLKRIIIGQIAISSNDGIEPFSDFDPAPKHIATEYENDGLVESDAFSVDSSSIQVGDFEFIGGVARMKIAA